jgi:Cu-Zn family superoxide dismutase
MKKLSLMCALLALALGTAIGSAKTPKLAAQAQLQDGLGKAAGTAKLKQTSTGVKISLQVFGLPVGTHAFHIHNSGVCDAPDFKTAGGHFNPESKKHGLKNPEGPHAGDMPNITVGANGKGKATVLNTRVTLAEGANSVFHEGGTALVVHEKADDEMTDPAGNAGARIACGLIEKTK